MKKKSFVLSMMLFLACIVFGSIYRSEAQSELNSDADIASIQIKIRVFFEGISESGGISQAYDELFRGGTVKLSSEDGTDDTIKQTRELMSKSTQWEHEYIDAKKIGKDVVQLRYLCKNESFPIVWNFTYYRAPNTKTGILDSNPSLSGWNCIGVTMDNDLTQFYK